MRLFESYMLQSSCPKDKHNISGDAGAFTNNTMELVELGSNGPNYVVILVELVSGALRQRDN